MDNVMCLGNEKTIKNCTFNADDDCGASEGAILFSWLLIFNMYTSGFVTTHVVVYL